MKRSFQKKTKSKIISIAGTKPSVHNSQLLVSSGIPSLDFLLCGGIPLGTLVLIEEDAFNKFSKQILKHFLVDGIINGNYVFVASFDDEPEDIIHNLPGLRSVNNNSNKNNNTKDYEEIKEDKLEIAWRYKNQKSNLEDTKSNYDLGKTLDVTDFNHLIFTYGLKSQNSDCCLKSSLFSSLLQNIQSKIKDYDLRPHLLKEKSNALRIVFNSMLSSLWCSQEQISEVSPKWREITHFFTLLKSIVRSSFSVALITVPSKMINPKLMPSLHGIVDYVLNLESFQGSEKEVNPLYKEYHGLVHIKKFPVLNTMVPHVIDFKDWAFHLNKFKNTLTFTRLHLPPEDSDTTSRSQENGKELINCSSSRGSKLDF